MVKVRQKSDHKHGNTHPDLSYQDKPAQTATPGRRLWSDWVKGLLPQITDTPSLKLQTCLVRGVRRLTKKKGEKNKDAFNWDYDHHGNRSRHKEQRQSGGKEPEEYSANQRVKRK